MNHSVCGQIQFTIQIYLVQNIVLFTTKTLATLSPQFVTMKKVTVILVFLTVGVDFALSESEPKRKVGERRVVEYCYEDTPCSPKSWSGVCQSGKHQSPINVNLSSSNAHREVDLIVNDMEVDQFFLQNDGHSLVLVLSPRNENISSFFPVSGSSGLSEDKIPYRLSQVVFRWGDGEEGGGSEHSVNDQVFSMEVQIMHYNPKYENLEDAISSGNHGAVAIVSAFLQVEDKAEPSEGLAPIIHNLPKVTKPHVSFIRVQEKFDIGELIPDDSPTVRILHYSGSMTTPGCEEVVDWFVLTEPSLIAPADVEAFRKLADAKGQPITSNIRPVKRNGVAGDKNKGGKDKEVEVELISIKQSPTNAGSKSDNMINEAYKNPQIYYRPAGGKKKKDPLRQQGYFISTKDNIKGKIKGRIMRIRDKLREH